MHISGKMSKEIAEEYASSLADLKVNSKPLINMLTILAEENIEHAGVIVDTVEKHLEKVQPEIKLPVLYLVDSIIKNVGGAYTQKFSQSIVNMFTRTFKQVDEKTRSQMFKLRETWHEVFPGTKLYQLDVKVNLIDPAWPIQAQPHHNPAQAQLNIHVNPNFLKKQPAPVVKSAEEEQQMRLILAKKEQELLMLQQKKLDMELEHHRKQLEMAEKSVSKAAPSMLHPATVTNVSAPLSVNHVSVIPPLSDPAISPLEIANMLPVKARLGPPVPRSVNSARIAPVSGAMLAATRRDPRLARHNPSASNVSNIAPNLFDIKPLRNKRKAITIDVQPDLVESTRRTESPRRDPRLDKRNREDNKRNRDAFKRNRDEDKRNNRDEDMRNAGDEKPTKDEDIRKNTDKRKRDRIPRKEEDKRKKDDKQIKEKVIEQDKKVVESPTKMDDYIKQVVDSKVINKLPPIPKLNRDDKKTDNNTKKKEIAKDKTKKKNIDSNSNSSDSPSPDKKLRKSKRNKEPEPPTEPEKVQFKELKNFHKERYMRRNKEKSESPEKITTKAAEAEASSASDPNPILENKDVDLRVLALPEKPAPITQKRSSTEIPDVLAKKSKGEKFDILFGKEDVDLRQLPQVEETISKAPDSPKLDSSTETAISPSPPSKTLKASPLSPVISPKQDWNQVKEKSDDKKKPSKLDLVRAKLAKATEGNDKDRLGRPLLFSKSPSLERERKRTMSSEDLDLRTETEDDVNKETISLILSQAKEHFKDGKMDKNQYNTLMFQVMQLNEKLKLKEAKQRESLENSKRKLHIAQKANEAKRVSSPKSSPRGDDHNKFGDIDERITPALVDNASNSQDVGVKDSDLRMPPMGPMFDKMDPVVGLMGPNFIPMPPMMPFMPGLMSDPGSMLGPGPGPRLGSMPMPPAPMPPAPMPQMSGPGPFPPMWRGPMPKDDFNGPRRCRAPGAAPFFRGNFDRLQRPAFEPRFVPPMPKYGMCQGESPLPPYERTESPPALGIPGLGIPPTDYKVLEYIDQDPMKTIEIDNVPREIRFYGETAIVMLDWDDPREIRFLSGSRRITFDNKDSVVLNLNDEYRQVEIDDQKFDIRLGAPTRELFINGKWYECFFGAAPIAIMIDNKPRLIQLEGPPPQVDISKEKRTELVAGKINLIVDAQHMCPLFLDAKVQKFFVDGHCYTIRFADAFKTVLINERPYKVEFGGLPKPIFVGKNKHFIRFSVLPRHVKPGQTVVVNMPGIQDMVKPEVKDETVDDIKMDVDQNDDQRPERIISPDGGSNHVGLDMLASLMPTSMAPASGSGYSANESKTDGIPGLEAKEEVNQESQPNPLSILGNINVNDLFAKLVATGIVPSASTAVEKENQEPKEITSKDTVHHVDLLRPETLRVKQPAVVSSLYGGMQCSGCGARFPPEHTVRYSQHLDWHFRQNRRDRDSARRAVSRLWHYDLGDWLQYEEYTDQLDAEKNYFDSTAENPSSPPPEMDEELPSVRAGPPVELSCALCGDKFDQFYNEDKDEWHLRKAIRFEDKNYHPLCYEDYKASVEKEKEQLPTPVDDIEEPKIDITDECIEIVGDEISQSGSDVEVLDNEKDEPVEIEDTYIESGDEDDVVLEQEPVEEVEVDDADTDDETKEQRATRDSDVKFSKVVVKQEPIDPDDEPIITAEEQAMRASADTTHHVVLSSIDGNVQLDTAAKVTTSITGGIRINITKPITTAPAQDNTSISSPLSKDDVCTSDEPLPPGEELEINYTVKDSLRGVEFSRQPPVSKGSELSGLCSIM